MSFNQKVPEWKNSGTEPSESLKESGFVGGYKPPASVFNWFWHSVSEALKELQGEAMSKVAVNLEDGNLNDKTDIGIYVYSAANASNIANTPEPVQSVMLVLPRLVPNNASNRLQMVLTQTNHLYLRNLADGTWEGWGRLRNSDEVIPVIYGGTGANSASGALASLGAFRNLGKQVISSITNDTVANWSAIDSGYTYYETAGLLKDQPTQYGFLLHFHQNTEVFQMWRVQSGGPTYWRSGNAQGWASTWRKVYDEQNKPSPADIGAATENHTHSSVAQATNADTVDGVHVQTTPGNAGLKPIYATTSDLTAGTSALATGTICFVYE